MLDTTYAIHLDGKVDCAYITFKSAEARFHRLIKDKVVKKGVGIFNMRTEKLVRKHYVSVD